MLSAGELGDRGSVRHPDCRWDMNEGRAGLRPFRRNQTQHNCPAMERRLPIVWEPSLTAGLVLRIREAGTEEVAIPALWNRVSMQEVDALASDPFVVLEGGRLTSWPALLPTHTSSWLSLRGLACPRPFCPSPQSLLRFGSRGPMKGRSRASCNHYGKGVLGE